MYLRCIAVTVVKFDLYNIYRLLSCMIVYYKKSVCVLQNLKIPTMDSGAEVAQRCLKELTDIQVGII